MRGKRIGDFLRSVFRMAMWGVSFGVRVTGGNDPLTSGGSVATRRRDVQPCLVGDAPDGCAQS
ncbi:hypothetical protein GCM10010405_56950 [Streptomyces macrosporus]|uniref:Uncharacterized protein n=1 Tax=Streptomyces macrosporus TaxID=44032 RepID=A0ABN3KKP3_9ACTN